MPSNIRKYFGIDDIYLEMLIEDGLSCEICDYTFNNISEINVDHCHTLNMFRGYICSHCNKILGFAKDNPQILKNAQSYLERKLENNIDDCYMYLIDDY